MYRTGFCPDKRRIRFSVLHFQPRNSSCHRRHRHRHHYRNSADVREWDCASGLHDRLHCTQRANVKGNLRYRICTRYSAGFPVSLISTTDQGQPERAFRCHSSAMQNQPWSATYVAQATYVASKIDAFVRDIAPLEFYPLQYYDSFIYSFIKTAIFNRSITTTIILKQLSLIGQLRLGSYYIRYYKICALVVSPCNPILKMSARAFMTSNCTPVHYDFCLHRVFCLNFIRFDFVFMTCRKTKYK